MKFHTTVEDGEQNIRLDKLLASKIPDVSRSRIQSLMSEGCVSRGDVTVTDCSYRVKPDDTFTVAIPPAKETHMVANDIPLDIVYEDEHLLVINKQAGLVVHPGAGNPDQTLANALIAHCGNSLSGIGGVTRPGIVHRLDKDTSGLMVVAKTDNAHISLSEQLQERELKRVYHAIVWGIPVPPAGKITANIGRHPHDRKKMTVMKKAGKHAITHYRTLKVLGNGVASLVECKLETGRTHQIRVHFLHKGNPLVGDPVYGDANKNRSNKYAAHFNRQALHSTYISFIHPETSERLEFEIEAPEDFKELLH